MWDNEYGNNRTIKHHNFSYCPHVYRGRVVRHTLILLFTTSAAQAAGVAYAQPGERQIAHVAALSAAALLNVSSRYSSQDPPKQLRQC